MFFLFENSIFLDENQTILNIFVIRLAGGLLNDLLQYQLNAVEYQKVEMEKSASLRALLEKWTSPLTENQMYDRSLLIFPRGTEVGEVEIDNLLGSFGMSNSIDPSDLLRVYNLSNLKSVMSEEEKAEMGEIEANAKRRKNLKRTSSLKRIMSVSHIRVDHID
jgi:hypothetical protein